MKLTCKKVEPELKGGGLPTLSDQVNWERNISSDVRINEHYTELEEEESYESVVQDQHAFVTEWTVQGKASVQEAFIGKPKDEFIVEW